VNAGSRIGSAASAHLDALRAVAALTVLLGHARSLFLVEYAAVDSLTLPAQIVYGGTGFGHQAVMIFFVLSGFLISSTIKRARQNGTWSWDTYLSRRLIRLLVVLLPALILTAVLDRIGVGLFGTAGIYGGHDSGNIIQFIVPSRDGLDTLLGNAAFLQEILVPSFGSNVPLWSLSYEFWYYVLYPLLIAIALPQPIGRRIAFGAGALAIVLFVGPLIASYFAVWIFGAVAARTVGRWRRAARPAGILAAAALVAAMIAARTHVLPEGLASDVPIALCAATLIWGIASVPASVSPELYRRAAATLAGFAYTLYLVHVPVLVFLRAALADSGRWQPDGLHLLALGVVTLATVGIAYGIGRLTEFKTDRVRTTFDRLLWQLHQSWSPSQPRS
jgi:peptidoglycan/LPS O-acetylase OafA/YrhL